MSQQLTNITRAKGNLDEGPSNVRPTLRKILQHLYPQSFFLGLSIAGFAIYAVTQPLSAVLIEWLIKTLDGEWQEGVVLLPLAFIAVAVVRGVGTYMGSYYISKVSQRMIESIRKDLFNKIIHLPLATFDQAKSGRFVSLFTYNSNLMANNVAKSVTVVAQEGLTVIALLAYLFWSSWQLTLVFLLIVPPIALIVNYVGKVIQSLSKDIQNSMAELNSTVTQSFSGIRLIKTSSGEEQTKKHFGSIASETRKLALRISKVNSIYTPSMQILIACAMAVLVVLVIRFHGEMETAALIAYVTAAALLSKPIRSLSKVHVNLTRAVVAANEVFAFMELPPEKNSGTVIADNIQGNIEFRNVVHRYADDGEPILNDLSFTIGSGETIALVGHSGGGKSTIANLVPRFYSLESGEILIDNINIEEYELSSLRNQIALVPQEVHLFNASIKENIGYGIEADHDDIVAAAKKANAHEFINDLKGGYDARVGDNGVLLSGGQRQRLAIARAILRDAKILILDEATSALDNNSERLVQSALEELQSDITTIIIAHRLSTIESADRIIVLSKGKIAEQGDHASLMAIDGFYASLLKMSAD